MGSARELCPQPHANPAQSPNPVLSLHLTASPHPGTARLIGKVGAAGLAWGSPAGPHIEGAETGVLEGLLLRGQLGQGQQVKAAWLPAARNSCKGTVLL